MPVSWLSPNYHTRTSHVNTAEYAYPRPPTNACVTLRNFSASPSSLSNSAQRVLASRSSTTILRQSPRPQHGPADGQGRLRQLHRHRLLRSGLPEGNQPQLYRQDEPRLRRGHSQRAVIGRTASEAQLRLSWPGGKRLKPLTVNVHALAPD